MVSEPYQTYSDNEIISSNKWELKNIKSKRFENNNVPTTETTEQLKKIIDLKNVILKLDEEGETIVKASLILQEKFSKWQNRIYVKLYLNLDRTHQML